MKEAIEPKTIVAIHTVVTALSLSGTVYRACLEKRYQVRTSKALTEAQGRDLVKHLNNLKSRKNTPRLSCRLCMPSPRDGKAAIPAETIYPASPEQLDMIEDLKEAIEWSHSDGFRRWLLKYFALSEIEFSPQASAVIFALQKLLKSQHKCSACKLNPKATEKRTDDRSL